MSLFRPIWLVLHAQRNHAQLRQGSVLTWWSNLSRKHMVNQVPPEVLLEKTIWCWLRSSCMMLHTVCSGPKIPPSSPQMSQFVCKTKSPLIAWRGRARVVWDSVRECVRVFRSQESKCVIHCEFMLWNSPRYVYVHVPVDVCVCRCAIWSVCLSLFTFRVTLHISVACTGFLQQVPSPTSTQYVPSWICTVENMTTNLLCLCGDSEPCFSRSWSFGKAVLYSKVCLCEWLTVLNATL